MNDKKLKEKLESHEGMARQIEEHAQKSDQHVIAAAMLMRDARKRIESGEPGDITWSKWAHATINLSKSWLYELNHIAEADNPEAELKRLRKETCERVRRHREKKAKDSETVRTEALNNIDEERQTLIAWAKDAPIDAVREVLSLIESEGDAMSSGPEDEHTESDQLVAA